VESALQSQGRSIIVIVKKELKDDLVEDMSDSRRDVIMCEALWSE